MGHMIRNWSNKRQEVGLQAFLPRMFEVQPYRRHTPGVAATGIAQAPRRQPIDAWCTYLEDCADAHAVNARHRTSTSARGIVTHGASVVQGSLAFEQRRVRRV